MILMARPQPDEYAPLYAPHMQRFPESCDIFAILDQQPDELRALLLVVSDEEASIRPAPEEWSIKEVIGHVCDTDRILSYRALRCARGDTIPLAGYNPQAYVAATSFNARPLSELLDEFAFRRRADLLCFRPLTEEELLRRGTTLDHPITARALLFVMGGHVMHHLESLKTSYRVGA